jgi:4-amino-4-deoxychorismate lyase
MSLFLESIYLNNGEFRNLEYHESRMRASSHFVFNNNKGFNLSELKRESFPSIGLFKIRVIYDTEIRTVECVPYEVRSVNSLKLVHDNEILYDHKFLDRSKLEYLYSLRGDADDVLIVKNGLMTDSFYANMIFKKDENWFTPNSYLLKGTMRQSLLNRGVIREAVITVENYTQYQSCKLINSMIGMDGPEIPFEKVS